MQGITDINCSHIRPTYLIYWLVQIAVKFRNAICIYGYVCPSSGQRSRKSSSYNSVNSSNIYHNLYIQLPSSVFHGNTRAWVLWKTVSNIFFCTLFLVTSSEFWSHSTFPHCCLWFASIPSAFVHPTLAFKYIANFSFSFHTHGQHPKLFLAYQADQLFKRKKLARKEKTRSKTWRVLFIVFLLYLLLLIFWFPKLCPRGTIAGHAHVRTSLWSSYFLS